MSPLGTHMTDQRLLDVTEVLYSTFSNYRHGGNNFCTFCYDPDEIKYYITAPVRDIEPDKARVLLWESADHWESADIFRHYLPRILEVIGPPWKVDLGCTPHLFGHLNDLGFRSWPTSQQQAVIAFLDAVEPHISHFDQSDKDDWVDGMASLRRWDTPN